MRRILIILLALAAAGATLFLLEMRQTGTQTQQADAPDKATVFALVFARDLPRGTLLDRGAVKWQEQLRGALSPEAILSEKADAPLPDGVTGRLLRSDVLTGEPVRMSFLVSGSASFMSLTLTPGMRAVGVPVTPQKLAGGYILPEDRVDLIHTIVADLDGDGRQSGYSQTILENVRVLAVGETPTSRVTFQTPEEQAAATEERSDVSLKGETVTLEMSDAEAAVLFSAMASGQISLALRAIEDQGPSRINSTIGIENAAKIEGEAPPPPPVAADDGAPPPPPPPPTTGTVRMIVGGVATEIEVPLAPASR